MSKKFFGGARARALGLASTGLLVTGLAAAMPTAQAAEEPTGPTTYDSGRYVVLLREAPAAQGSRVLAHAACASCYYRSCLYMLRLLVLLPWYLMRLIMTLSGGIFWIAIRQSLRCRRIAGIGDFMITIKGLARIQC